MMEKRYEARSGINVYTYKNPALHGFCLSLFVRAGVMYESEGERGITHFLEHVMVRNVNKIRSGGLYPTLDKRALEFNASTYAEMVQFYVSGAKENFAVATDIITSLFEPITLSKSEIDTERRRIKAEIREADDKNSLAGFTAEVVFEGTSLGTSILGTNKSVDAINRTRLEEYRRRVFGKENIFFYVTGSFEDSDVDALLGALSKLSLSESKIDPPRLNIAPVPRNFGKRGGAVHVKNADFTMLRFTFDIDMTRVRSQVLDLIYDMLLSGYNSPFFIEMSEERGLFYDISGATERYRNIGTLHFTYEVKERDVYDAASLSVKILNDFKNKVFPDDECMKGSYTDNAYLLYDDAREMGFTFAYDNHIMNERYASIDERRAAYKSISPLDIKEASNEIFKTDNLTVTVKGNKKKIDVEKLKNIITQLGG